MGTEVERKFLVRGEDWREGATGEVCRQGYLAASPRSAVRVRVLGGQGYITVKSPKQGISRHEFEYGIPLSDAEFMIENLSLFPPVEKVRYSLTFDGWSWVVDVFSGANRGLVLAEIELPSPTTAFPEPPWLGVEVSDDPRYFNSRLTQCPFTTWPENNP